MLKRLELWGVWFDVDVDYTLGRPAITYPIDRAALAEDFSMTINAICYCGENMMDFMSESVIERFRELLIESAVYEIVDDDSDYKHDLHMCRRIGETI